MEVHTLPGQHVVPAVHVFETCAFPVVEGRFDQYRVLVLPPLLRRFIDARGVGAVRIHSREIARSLPDFGGKASGEYSLLPHRDHLDPRRDQRRYLVLSKTDDGARGASTLLMSRNTAVDMLLFEEGFFRYNRQEIGKERKYDTRFHISEHEYDRCYDESDGFEHVLYEVLARHPAPLDMLTTRLGLLGYLIRGSMADEAMRTMYERFGDQCYEERWERGGLLIVDNRHVFHARLGGNDPPLKRHFFV